MHINPKSEHDPIADFWMVDGYMRWALEAAREQIGDEQLAAVLRRAGLEHFINNYPAGDLSISGEVTFGQYAAFSAALVSIYGLAGKNLVEKIGHFSVHRALDYQRSIYNMAIVDAAKDLNDDLRVKLGLSAIVAGLRTMLSRRGQEFQMRIEDQGEHWAVIAETCSLCSGLRADGCIGWLFEGMLEEAARQTLGAFFDVVEVACRAKGDPAGVWLVSKRPGDETAGRSAPYVAGAETPLPGEIQITDRPELDPMMGLNLVDAYLRWALDAVEAVIGAASLAIILRQAGLERLIEHPPSRAVAVESQLTFGDYARFNAALINFFGRGAESLTRHVGRVSAQQARRQQFETFNLSQIIGSLTLPPADLLKLGLDMMNAGYRQMNEAVGQQWRGHVEDRGDCLAIVIETCPMCAGKQAGGCLGGFLEGALEESIRWLMDERYAVKETACRAKGDPAGVWEVRKSPEG
ncbi:MAG: hypothetical protein HXY41_09455 [Chloroflexi bacterium]|nr:hypothetical protein [Chloroflexota bacterium]